jgi:hypothetical protein
MAGFRSSYNIFWRTFRFILILFAGFNMYFFWQNAPLAGEGESPISSILKRLNKIGDSTRKGDKGCAACGVNPQELGGEILKEQDETTRIGEWEEAHSPEINKVNKARKVLPVTKGISNRDSRSDLADAYFRAHQVETTAESHLERSLEDGQILAKKAADLPNMSPVQILKSIEASQRQMKEHSKILQAIEVEGN